MKKVLISLVAVGLFSSCSPQGEESEPADTTKTTDEKPITVNFLRDRFSEGMDYSAYSVEVQSWVEKGQADIQKTITVPGQKNVSADIIQVADGFLAVVNNGREITLVKPFETPETAITYLENNL